MANSFAIGKVVSAESPTLFFVKFTNLASQERTLRNLLPNISLEFQKEFIAGTLCLLAAHDFHCHRERVEVVSDPHDAPNCNILLIDEGVRLSVPKLCLFRLPDNLKHQDPLAWKCCLAEVPEATPDQVKDFQLHFQEKACEVAKINKTPAGIWVVKMKTRFEENCSQHFNPAAQCYD